MVGKDLVRSGMSNVRIGARCILDQGNEKYENRCQNTTMLTSFSTSEMDSGHWSLLRTLDFSSVLRKDARLGRFTPGGCFSRDAPSIESAKARERFFVTFISMGTVGERSSSGQASHDKKCLRQSSREGRNERKSEIRRVPLRI